MNEVPLREYQEAINRERTRTIAVAFIGLVAVGWAVIQGMEKATHVALAAANEKGVAHNGLIDRMREMSKQYVTWPVVLLLMALAVSIVSQFGMVK
jgi:hypothetical protein